MSSTCPCCGSILGFGHVSPMDSVPFDLSAYHTAFQEPISDETMKLAQMVAEMDPLPDDPKSIEEWAKRLAADIAKGKD